MNKQFRKEQKKLLRLVKKKGILVQTMNPGDNFLVDRPTTEYKINLGAVMVYSFFKKQIKNVYVVFEDYDGSIKYYDYPQITEKMVKKV